MDVRTGFMPIQAKVAPTMSHVTLSTEKMNGFFTSGLKPGVPKIVFPSLQLYGK